MIAELSNMLQQTKTLEESWFSRAESAGLSDGPDGRRECKQVVALLKQTLQEGALDYTGPAWSKAREELLALAVLRRARRYSPLDTARWLSMLRRPLVRHVILEETGRRDMVETVSDVIDELVFSVMDGRIEQLGDVIEQQRQEMEELSTPVIEIWNGVLVLPLVGTLDSHRAELVMEGLLNGIERHRSRVAILDITGVSTVDEGVASRLLKTADAAQLMGANVIISGLSPRIARTIVQLGIDVGGQRTTMRLSEALGMAFELLSLEVVAS